MAPIEPHRPGIVEKAYQAIIGKYRKEAQRGRALLDCVTSVDRKSLDNLKSKTDYEVDGKKWDLFMSFPLELKELYHGTYIDPKDFVHSLGITSKEETQNITRNLLSDYNRGVDENDAPVFRSENVGGSNFSISVSHGLTNEHALRLTELSLQDGPKFENDNVRREYQQEVSQITAPQLKEFKAEDYGVVVHDDCIASGDTVVNFLLNQIKQAGFDESGHIKDEKLKKGVKVIIDGPATAQSILLLKKISDEYGIKIDLSAGYMAFGLSDGELQENGTRAHANYITYPERLIMQIKDKNTRRRLVDAWKKSEGDLMVVGDMGNAEVAYKAEDDDESQDITHINYLRIQDTSDSSQTNAVEQQFNANAQTDYVIFPRGGELSAAMMMHFKKDELAKMNVVPIRASRLDDPVELGYGVGFKKGWR